MYDAIHAQQAQAYISGSHRNDPTLEPIVSWHTILKSQFITEMDPPMFF